MRKEKYHTSRNGSALIAIMAIVMILGAFGIGKLANARLASAEAIRLTQRHQQELLAEMGFNELHSILIHEDNRRTFERLGILSKNNGAVLTKTTYDNKNHVMGRYDVFVTVADESDPALADYIIESISYSAEGQPRVKVTAYSRLTTVSKYAWGTDDEGGGLFLQPEIICTFRSSPMDRFDFRDFRPCGDSWKQPPHTM